MSNVVNITAETNELDTIPGQIADLASKTVENIWRIGSLLNRAKLLHAGDDNAFGAWRREHVTQPLGIAERTQRTFMRIAANWTLDGLPKFLGITALHDVACMPETKQDTVVDYLAEQAVNGKRIPLSTVHMAIKRVEVDGYTTEDLNRMYRAEVLPDAVDVEGAAELVTPTKADDVEPSTLAPVTVDQEGAPQPNVAPRAAEPVEDASVAWAKRVVGQLKAKGPTAQLEMLAALVAELRIKDAIDADDVIVMLAQKQAGNKVRLKVEVAS